MEIYIEGVGMPTYQYECTSCGHQFEQIQSFADEPIKNCPECNSEVKKIYSAVGVVFKGSGFYKTDSAPKSSD
jgi:putative FmdB family regulatory protein